MDGWMDAWMHGCTDAWMHGCMDGWRDGWMERERERCIYIYIMHLARVLAFATQSAMLSCQLVLHAPSFMPFSVSLPFNAYFYRPHVDWAVPLLATKCDVSFTKTHLLKQFLIEAMDTKQPESQESQELPEASRPHPPQATSTTSPIATETQNLNLPGNIELIAESLLLQRNPEQTKDGKSFLLHYQLRM